MTIEQLRAAAAANLDHQERKIVDIKVIERLCLTIIICSVAASIVAMVLS